MDTVFDAQFRVIKDAFARENIEIAVAYTAGGDVDYVYEAGRLLAAGGDDNRSRLAELLPGIQLVGEPDDTPEGTLATFSIEALEDGHMTVPEALDLLDERLGPDNPALREDGLPLATPNHLLHIARLCSAVEPEVPSGVDVLPWPPPRQPGEPVRPVTVDICDTGLLEDAPAGHQWLDGVTGEPDMLGPVLPGGLQLIPPFVGHGTFIAGVARCMAPEADVFVADHFRVSGAELESEIIDKLEQLALRSPDIINLSAGTYTRNNWTSLGFEGFHRRNPAVTLIAAAGNDSTDRPFYPAAYRWTLSVGALGPDERHRAWFSNYGDWVDLYALGEGIINAYASGEYVYQEPPKRPAKQIFRGMARWDGTSFSAPLVAGLIAARMSRTGESSPDAARAVLAVAESQTIAGVGPMLFAGDQPWP